MDEPGWIVRAGRAADAGTLSRLAMRSKAHWGYDGEFLAACRESLTYRPEEIDSGELEVVVAEQDGDDRPILAFGALCVVPEGQPEAGELEVEALFVDPDWIGRGLGAALLDHLADRARARGGERLWILSDPHAEAFYRARGAVTIEQRPSDSIAGRTLPWMSLDCR